ncbi:MULTISPECIES: hypothetical protein [Paraburkholderia]|uniref:hypothetical protein n=1 Tax=Paraburkholderia TaxID=1822464 RepID=UPI0003A049EA|nr:MULTISPECIES: hypothetical protein [Paraburkholderia]MDH6152304.1 hypothetical protein [Paraburkholderia sp. WSM4179]
MMGLAYQLRCAINIVAARNFSKGEMAVAIAATQHPDEKKRPQSNPAFFSEQSHQYR